MFFALSWPAVPTATAAAQALDGNIQLQVSPDTTLLRPLKDAATVTIDYTGPREAPVTPVDLSVRLTAPPPGTLVSTDFPLIEGTRLFDVKLTGVTGPLSLDYVFPIRGEYRLDVSATDRGGGRLERSFTLRVRENSAKTAFLAGFVAALFLLGFIAGRIFSTPASVGAVLALALLSGTGPDPGRAAGPDGTAGPREALTVTSSRVGVPGTIRWRRTNPQTGKPVPSALTLRVVQLEKDREIFVLKRWPTDGKLDIAFHFTDASPHRVGATSTTPGRQQASEIVTTVDVAPATPSFGTRGRPVLFFILVVLAGLAAGRFSKRHRVPLPWPGKRVKIHTKEAS